MLAPTLLLWLAAAASPPPQSALPGSWSLDEDKSDDAREKMRGSSERSGPPGGGGGRGGFGGGHMGGGGMRGGGMGGGGRRGGAESDADRAAIKWLMDGVLDPPKNLVVAVAPTEVTITPDDGTPLHLHADGKKAKAEDGTSLERKTKWDGANLVTETQVGTGFSLKETYAVTGEGNLQVTQHLERPWGKALDLRRLYERAPGPQPAPVQSVEPKP